MNHNLEVDLTEMERKLKCYVDKGRVAGGAEVREEPIISVKPDASNIKPLRKMNSYEGQFLAVDCSTRTLKRANNWGIYVLRAACAVVKGRDVQWDYEEQICTEIGDAYTRRNTLANRRMELESKKALEFLHEEHTVVPNVLRKLDEGDYILLDGASFFGGERGFAISLYEGSLRRRMNLICISKQSPALHDERGRDFTATTFSLCSSYPIWVYHPVKKANKDKHLYGDISIIKLCEDSPRAFRCDVMEYLASTEVNELLSPLTSISGDPRCVGYPISLWLAHDFSAPSDSKLLQYLNEVEKRLANVGVRNTLRSEELSCNFADELHNVRYPFKREMVGDYV